jgi:hypothetical protein
LAGDEDWVGVSKARQEIDSVVYRLFKLTKSEIELIQSSLSGARPEFPEDDSDDEEE